MSPTRSRRPSRLTATTGLSSLQTAQLSLLLLTSRRSLCCRGLPDSLFAHHRQMCTLLELHTLCGLRPYAASTCSPASRTMFAGRV
eukprot:1283990-Rhodomonas_salina.2